MSWQLAIASGLRLAALFVALFSLPAGRADAETWRFTLIGDTPYDVAAGRALGVPVLGVASGHYAAPELLAAGAGRAAADFRNLAGWMEWLEETLESQ